MICDACGASFEGRRIWHTERCKEKILAAVRKQASDFEKVRYTDPKPKKAKPRTPKAAADFQVQAVRGLEARKSQVRPEPAPEPPQPPAAEISSSLRRLEVLHRKTSQLLLLLGDEIRVLRVQIGDLL